MKDVLTNRGKAGVVLKFVTGPNAGKTATSGSDGTFHFTSLQQDGMGRLEGRASGFETFVDEFVLRNRLPRYDLMISPAMSPGSLRFILAWGRDPSDLDTHVTTPSGCRVWYANKACRDGQNIDLDIDHTGGYGPETVTMRTAKRGTYYYYVNKYSGVSNIKESQGEVKVLHKRPDGGMSIHTFVARLGDRWTRSGPNWAGPQCAYTSALWWNVFSVTYDPSGNGGRGSFFFNPDGEVSEGARVEPPPAPPIPPPTFAPTNRPSRLPTRIPTNAPLFPATNRPTEAPTRSPTDRPLRLTGQVKSAVNGEGVANVMLLFTSGPNFGKTARSGSDGTYSFDSLAPFPAGTLEARYSGYETWVSTFNVANRFPRIDIMMSPYMSPNSLRFVLAWGLNPVDLDIRLATPTGCQVAYFNKQCADGQQNVQLDNDVTSGYGPETISMARPMNGVYTFYVNKYYGLGSIKDSQAVVQVWDKPPNGPLRITEFKAKDATKWTSGWNPSWNGPFSSADSAKWWNVFSFDTRTRTLSAA